MKIEFTPSYGLGSTKFFCVHNTGGLGINARVSTQHLTPEAIDRAHKDRFGMLSTLGHWGGYNFYIESNGALTQFRAIGEETAAQRGHNFDGETISVCLAGNFTKGVDVPTKAQIEMLRALYEALPQVPASSIVPHRLLQSGTDCYGALPDDWARQILGVKTPAPMTQEAELKMRISILQQMLALWNKVLDLQRQLRTSGLGAILFGSQSANSCSHTDVRG